MAELSPKEDHIQPDPPDDLALSSVCVQMIHSMKRFIHTTRAFTRKAQGKFTDEVLGDSYRHLMEENAEQADVLLDSLLGYLKVRAPIRKTNTVHALIDGMIKDCQAKLEEGGIRVSRAFEENLPETIVPREHLSYILDSIFQYALSSMSPKKTVEFVTRSFTLKTGDGAENPVPLMKERRYIEILIVFLDDNKPRMLMEGGKEFPFLQGREGFNLILRLAKDVVERNQGIWKIGWNEIEKKSMVSLRFPAERRRVVYYSFPERKREQEEKKRQMEIIPPLPPEHSSQATYYITLDGRYINASSALARILGYESSDELRRTVKNVAGEIYVDPDHHAHLLRLLRERGAIEGFQSRVRRKDGSEIWISESVRVVADSNKVPICYEGTVENITEQKRLEARQLHPQKMEVVKRMAGGLAHDFNNILAVIIGNSDLLLCKLRPEDTAYSEIKAIKESAERAARLTNKLLTLSQGQIIHPEVLNLNDLIRGMDARVKDVLGSNIAYHLVLEPNLKPVKADRLQLEQVILHLVSNAKEAMPKGGELRISTENTRLDENYCRLHPEAVPGESVRVGVWDTGIGIPPRIMGHLFEPFLTVKPSGKGLGLALVYSIVKKVGGHVTLSSKESRGTAVKIYFPAFVGSP